MAKLVIEDSLNNGDYEYREDGQLTSFGYRQQGKVIYYKSYDEKGQVKACVLPITVTPLQKPPFQRGQTLRFHIALTYSPLDSVAIHALIGPLDEKHQLKETLDSCQAPGRSVIYTMKSVPQGENTLSGVLIEYEGLNKNYTGHYPFRYTFRVE